MALLWCEARCDRMEASDPDPCRQTAPGSFGVAHASKLAKRAGWEIVAGEWVCHACIRLAKREASQNTA